MCCRVDWVCLDDTYGRDEWKGNDVDTGNVWRGASRDKSSCMCVELSDWDVGSV